MENINNLDTPNRYMQGSVWKWRNDNEQREGVQAGERPVMVISNNNFNAYSPSVNCVTITSQLKESPVHVPLRITADSHIQCEQIHTLNKNDLTDFIGIVPNSTVTAVKAKLRIQFDMSTDKNAEMFSNIKQSIAGLNTNPEIMSAIKENLEKLNAKANKGFGVIDIENDFLRLVVNLEESVGKIVAEVNKLKVADRKETPVETATATATEGSREDARQYEDGSEKPPKPAEKEPAEKEVKTRGKRKNYIHYTHEDKIFIADKNNAITAVMERFGYDKTSTG